MINHKFLEDNRDQLIQIYVKERVLNYGKMGALFVDFSKPNNTNVYFLTLTDMPENVREQFLKKDNINQKNTVFIYVKDENESLILDILV
jgi:hypothetical protein|tara:strand:+ start:527 stop:796 length:270 start_codon:yes stop_codon:yes gene_type:complete